MYQVIEHFQVNQEAMLTGLMSINQVENTYNCVSMRAWCVYALCLARDVSGPIAQGTIERNPWPVVSLLYRLKRTKTNSGNVKTRSSLVSVGYKGFCLQMSLKSHVRLKKDLL